MFNHVKKQWFENINSPLRLDEDGFPLILLTFVERAAFEDCLRLLNLKENNICFY